MTTIKSVHIEGCWPYQYVKPDGVAPVRGKPKVISQASKDRANARKREIYHAKKKLLQLKVYDMDIDFCNEMNQRKGLNDATTR